MLTSPRRRGFTLVEAMVVLTILGIMLAYGVPAFSTWLQNTRIRATAEAIQQGLQLAKSEAAARNTRVRFQLTSDLSSACTRSTSQSNWVIDVVDANVAQDSVEGACNAAISESAPSAPSILHRRAAAEGSAGVVVDASVDDVVFTGLGRVTPLPADSITYEVTGLNFSDCRSVAGGTLTCLRVLVSPAGQVRMCNPSFPSGDPQAC